MPTKLRLHAAPATLVSLAVILALAVAGVMALSGAEAANTQPKCGDHITADTTLHHDLVNCPNNGIIIGADNVTLDLNYHTIDGDGTPAAGCDPETDFCDFGVLNRGHDGVTVVHGSEREFDIGVFVVRASHNRLLGISASGNQCCGFGFFRDTRSVIRNSSGSGSVAREGGNGIFLIESHHVRILHNSFRNNGDQGIFTADSTHNLIKGNRLSRNRFVGMHLGHPSDRNRVVHNRSVRDGGGILMDRADRNVIARNRISHPRGVPRVVGEGRKDAEGIGIDAGRGNLVAHNVVVHAGTIGIRLGIQRFAVGSDNTVVRRNRVRGSGGDAFVVNEKDHHSLLKRNVATGAGDDGFDIESRTAKLTKNRAVRNHDLGIEAVRGVIDGGGNKASGNGHPRQCTHIVCR